MPSGAILEGRRNPAGKRPEQAIDELIIALHTRAEAVTDQEREDLHTALAP